MLSCPTTTFPANSTNIGGAALPDSPNSPKVFPVWPIFIDFDTLRTIEIIEKPKKNIGFSIVFMCSAKLLPNSENTVTRRPTLPKIGQVDAQDGKVDAQDGQVGALDSQVGAQDGQVGARDGLFGVQPG